MKIKELYIENFGKLSKFKLTCSDGLNSFTEDNGYGKTTLSVFIKTMFYGFDDTRRQSLDENDRKKHTPWQGGAFGGYLVYEKDGTAYRIERTFGTKAAEDTFRLYNLNTGRAVVSSQTSLGEELFGIDRDGFERTVFLSEKNLSGKNTNQSISAKLSNLVGANGDIGDFDDAIKLLDERRKFYQKRGGAGEIRDVVDEISELEYKIKSLTEKQKICAESALAISTLNERIAALKRKKEGVIEKERKEKLEREKRSFEIQYGEMLGALKIDEARERELLEFFEKKFPTNAEIALADENASEIKRLERKLYDMGENTELSSLKKFFSFRTTSEECEKMKVAAKRLSKNRAEVISHKASYDISPPFKRMPTESEIDSYVERISPKRKKSNDMSLPILAIGILVMISGILGGALVSSVLFLLAAIGFLLSFVGIFPMFSKSGDKVSSRDMDTTLEFIYEVYGENKIFSSVEEALVIMKNDLHGYLAKSKGSIAIGSSDLDIGNVYTLEREIREFCEKFPEADGLTLEEKTDVIAYKRRRFEMLLEFEAENEASRNACRDEIRHRKESFDKFIALFPIKSGDPLSEIRRNLAEYEVIRDSLRRRRGDAERFAASHGINLSTFAAAPMRVTNENDFSKALFDLEDELISLEREKSRRESEYRILSSEIDTIDELEERLLEKREKIALFKENLSVITKTKDLLERARDSMTARYLEATKRGFKKYVRLINEETGEFTVDTSFNYMKSDLGSSREAEAYSRGTRDAYALAMRLALIDALYSDEAPPIMLDDPFVALDDIHVERGISILKRLSKDRQIFYFTCSKSRKIK